MREAFEKFRTFYRHNPVAFVRDLIGAEPTPQQCDLLNSYVQKNQIAVRSGHGTGKAACASWLALHFLCCWPMSRVVATAPTYRQLFDILKSEVVKWLRRSRLRGLFEVQSDRIFMRGFKDTWWMRFVSVSVSSSPEEQAEPLAGSHEDNLLVIVDAASAEPDPVFLPVESFLTKPNNKVILISNPTRAKGYFYDVFNQPKVRRLWHLLHWDSEESPNVSRAWVERYREKYGVGHPVYRVRVKGEFPTGGDNVLIPIDWVRQCVDYNFGEPEEEAARLPVVAGLDVARYGSDQTALVICRGRYVLPPKRTFQLDTVSVAEWTAEHLSQFEPQLVGICVDVTGGLGAGVADQLRRWFSGKVYDVNFAWKAFAQHYYHRLRDELWWRARTACERISWSLPDDQDLLDELSMPTYKELDGKIKVQSKDELRNKGLGSPDTADAACCTRFLERALSLTAFTKQLRRKRRKHRHWRVA